MALAVAGLAAALPLAGCLSLARVPEVDLVLPTAALPLPPSALHPASLQQAALAQAQVQAPSGAIFRADSYRPLFENHRARMVGDTITVQISEKVSATQSSTSNVDRKGSVSASISALPLLKSSSLTRASATGSDSNTYEGKGTTVSSNDFSGTITATVVQVLPNGHLVISAEKQVGVNANVDVLRFSGQVDPRAIAPGNSVQSTQIANVRVEQRGRGQQAEAQSMGWLARFFLNVLPI
ncbi:flagellar basal body L-ring protein FlgH [Aquabacterium sp. OR-4]|uniref:flagellar basal body L-ring protein FlgH n=1 Tax=Aquabacterium sp. OR-4 TaxID=2978127 RepID=UPI0021B1729B|nr:flagellar basal body L-ring protein FlgH [Aquabacterium sp. OR-4]MDT7836189.1 flagellar basal body L-ring protein FlgH [Aquabacterium sp. OR-4]